MAFKVGQMVCCIKRGRWSNEGNADTNGHVFPKYGDVLTIREVLFDPTDGDCCLKFEEIHNPHTYADFYGRGRSDESCYIADRFRPLVETNIDIFQAILVNPHREVELT